MTFKFLGKPDARFPELKTGKTYDLSINEYWYTRGPIAGNHAPVIISPFHCPYSSWEMFLLNWKKV